MQWKMLVLLANHEQKRKKNQQAEQLQQKIS